MWLKLATTNHDPSVILFYFLETVQNVGGYIAFGLCMHYLLIFITAGCPTLIRADCGTENGLVAAVQYGLRSSGDDSLAGEKSFRYGTSPANVV